LFHHFFFQDDIPTALRGHRRGSSTRIRNIRTEQTRKIRDLVEGMDIMQKKLTLKALEQKIDEGSSSDFARRVLFEDVARKLETILTVEENSDKMKSLVNPGIEHIHRALVAIKNSAEKDSGSTFHAEDFSKTLSPFSKTTLISREMAMTRC
jgi:hypothetical protein